MRILYALKLAKSVNMTPTKFFHKKFSLGIKYRELDADFKSLKWFLNNYPKKLYIPDSGNFKIEALMILALTTSRNCNISNKWRSVATDVPTSTLYTNQSPTEISTTVGMKYDITGNNRVQFH